jgi:uncharacterized protein (TIGR00297 family)
MTSSSNRPTVLRPKTLRWQSQLLLAASVLCISASLLFPWIEFPWIERRWIAPALLPSLLTGLVIASVFGLLVWRLRAATPGAALTGSLFTVSFYLAAPGLRTLLWPLLALFILTFAATRFGRARKEELQVAEERTGRSAAQVAANLGAAALATIPLQLGHFFIPSPPVLHRSILDHPMLIASIAALAEATADTLSSELGEVLGGEPLLLTTLRRVPAGTDGAVSLAGTLAGCAGAAAIALIGMAVLPLSFIEGLAAFAAAVFGLFFDSLLGATLERCGWLNNDAVNFLSTCVAALVAALVAVAVRPA